MVAGAQDRLVRDFYSVLMALGGPAVIGMFPTDMRKQRGDFGRVLVQWVLADDPDGLREALRQLGADHRKYDVEPKQYEVAGTALVAAWRGVAGRGWTAAHEAVIREAYGKLAGVMVQGALDRAADQPYWGAEVIAHHRPLDDFAVVTVRPDQPYPFRAGQYTTVELARRPKLWRPMSIASAPRASNTFDLHVRAVPGGDVSTALVVHTRPGDRLRLGPARGGALVVEPGTASGLVCVASGTGAAPIAAVVESVLRWPTPPTVHAYVGARSSDDLYVVGQMTRLGSGLPNVHVAGVVSDDPEYMGLRGNVAEVVPGLAPWAAMGFDVLLSGPPRMTDLAVDRFVAAGVPEQRIHFDPYEVSY
jgi:NAD(P)H-flavin reductase/hemoglobin-like flavoprotein